MIDVERFTRTLFESIDARGFRHCLYNGYEQLPECVLSDLDIAVEHRSLQYLDEIMFEVTKFCNLALLSKIWHERYKVAYVVSPYSLQEPERIQIDFFSEFVMINHKKSKFGGRYCLLEEDELLEGCKTYLYFFIPSPSKEFIFKLLRRIIKEDFNEEKFENLYLLFMKNQSGVRTELTRYFSSTLVTNILFWFETQNIKMIQEHLPVLKKYLKESNRYENYSYRLFKNLSRAFHRIRYPVGMTVAFLGPDGSGKTEVAKNTLRLFSSSFHRRAYFYWRPGLLKAPGVQLGLRVEHKKGTNPTPHAHQPEPSVKSLFRFVYYLIDFTVGYIVKVQIIKIKKGLCVFDRYYHDILIDKFRYNFSLPEWLLKLPLPLIPRPDLTIILDVPVEELLRRKQELAESELGRQRAEFLKFIGKIPNAYIVDNHRPIHEVIQEITSVILLNKSYQTYFSLNLKNQEDAEYFKNLATFFNISKYTKEGQSLTAFPNADAPRVFFAANNFKYFKPSLQLYTPSRPIIKFIYNNTPHGLLYAVLKKQSKNKFYLANSHPPEKIKSIFPACEAISICTGAPGPHRKPLVQVLAKNGKVLGYIKIGINKETNDLLEREKQALNLIESLNLKSACIPDIVEKGEVENGVHYLALKAIDIPFKKSYKITDSHINFMKEMFEKTGKEEIFKNTKLFSKMEERINLLEDKISYHYILRYKRILEFFENKKIPISFSHGDFTPWNVFLVNNRQLLLFDWEYSRESIAFADFFHFIIQSKIFSQKKSLNPQHLLWVLKNQIARWGINTNHQRFGNWYDLLLIYIFEISSFYFERNFKAGFIEKDLRLEITWSKLLDKLIVNYTGI